MLSVGPTTTVFAPETAFTVPAQEGPGRSRAARPRPDREPESIGELIARLGADSAQTVTFRDGPDGEPVTSRFIFVRVRAAHRWRDDSDGSGGARAPSSHRARNG